jgi:hypothetical protein
MEVRRTPAGEDRPGCETDSPQYQQLAQQRDIRGRTDGNFNIHLQFESTLPLLVVQTGMKIEGVQPKQS